MIRYQAAIAQRVATWAAELLGPYFVRGSGNRRGERKQIVDPVAHLVDLAPWEVYFLDSPLVQRLRRLNGVEFGEYAFPAAHYSRLEHALGRLHVAGNVFDSATSSASVLQPFGTDPIQLQTYRDIVRLAALLQDCGATAMGRVAERYYSDHEEIRAAQKFLQKVYATQISVTTALSLLVVQCEAFNELLERSELPPRGLRNNDILTLLAACIAGSKLRTAPRSFLAEIVNGAVDCAVLDSVARTALLTDAPISLSLARLIAQMRIAAVPSTEYGVIWGLGVTQAGMRALEQLLFGRLMLHDTVDLHSRRVAAEEVFLYAFRHAVDAAPALADPVELLRYSDEGILGLNADSVAERYATPPDHPGLLVASTYLDRLRSGWIPKRAFAMAARFLPAMPDALARYLGAQDGWVSAVGQLEYMQVARMLETVAGLERISEDITRYAQELGGEGPVFIAHRRQRAIAGGLTLPVVLPEGSVDVSPQLLFRSHQWAEAYALNRATSYVFAYDTLTEVHLAAERALAERGVWFAPSSWAQTKANGAAITERRRELGGPWIAHRLRPDYLRQPEVVGRIRTIAGKFASFLNAFDPELGPQLPEAWLSQFPDADLQESALRLLEHVLYVEPASFVEGMRRILKSQPSLSRGVWIPLRGRGGGAKSSDQLLLDLREEGLALASLENTSRTPPSPQTPVVLFDDGLNTGVQASCLLGAWFGDGELCDNDSDRDPAGELPSEVKQVLRECELHFAFFAAHSRGEASLRTACERLGLDLRGVHSTIKTDERRYTLRGLRCASEESMQRLRAFLESKGTFLLRDRVVAAKRGWTEDKAREYALGFGGLELTVLYRHSVSSAVPVALWRESTDVRDPWLPVFPRKKKPVAVRLTSGFRW